MKSFSGKIISAIPNFLTLLNLTCGYIAILYVFNDQLQIAFWIIILAAIFDFLDGFAARALNMSTKTGEILDSLADMVSFGIVPASVAFNLLNKTFESQTGHLLFIIISSFIAIFSCLRLAKFHTYVHQKNDFLGLPTPANALFFVSLGYISQMPENNIMQSLVEPYCLIPLIIGFSMLMISNLPMFSLKMKNLSFTNNAIQYIFLFIALILLIIFKVQSIPMIIILYILLSVMNRLFV
ncbi:MAG: CDP-diacylglycerol--serine O-phosphatidyltransferase [Bacteroidota bacterium]